LGGESTVETRSSLNQPYRPLNGWESGTTGSHRDHGHATNQTQPIKRMRGRPLRLINLRVFLTGTHAKPAFKAALQPHGPWERSTCTTLCTCAGTKAHPSVIDSMNGDPETGTASSGFSDVNVIYGGSKSTASRQLNGESPPVCSNDQPGFAPPAPWLSIYLLLWGKHFVKPRCSST
jgi:hypothetical protein